MVEDSQLWERIRRREPQAFDALYREMGPRLLRYLQQIVGNRQAASGRRRDARDLYPNVAKPQRLYARERDLASVFVWSGKKAGSRMVAEQ
jgi:hypothetical protein